MAEPEQTLDTNAAIWKSDEAIAGWMATMDDRERKWAPQWRLMAELLPVGDDEAFTFLDLGAGTGAAARALLARYPRSEAILADYSPQMMGEAARVMSPYDGRYRYVELDMLTGDWPASIPGGLDAAVTSHCVHHLPDERKAGLFAEILEHLAPGGCYLNFDPVTSEDPVVDAAWRRAGERLDPEMAERSRNRTPAQQAQYENHIRYMVPLDRQVRMLVEAGFEAVDVYWKQLDNVIYGGRRPLGGA